MGIQIPPEPDELSAEGTSMKWLTLDEVVGVAGCGVARVRRAIFALRLPAGYASRWLVEERDLLKWIEEGRPDALGVGAAQELGVANAEWQRLAKLDPDDMAVYLVQRGEDGPVKIGRVNRVKMLPRRLQNLQNGSAERLQLRRVILTEPGEGLEKTLHERFAEHRMVGEWFAPAPEVLEFANEWLAWEGVRRSSLLSD